MLGSTSNYPQRSASRPLSASKEAQLAAASLVKGLTTAPELAASSPCLILLPTLLHTFQQSVHEIGHKRSISASEVFRSRYGTALDAIVAFANSIWTPEERAMFEDCKCKRHDERDIQLFNQTTYKDTRGYCAGYGPMHETVFQVFLVIASVASDIRINETDAIRLERKAKKRGKWPSSPSKFMPHGAHATVSAFMAWARLAESIMPLHALGQMTFCCPSLEPAMTQNKELLPLINTLFSQFVSSIRTLNLAVISFDRRTAIEQDVLNFFHLFTTDWFLDQNNAAKTDKSIARTFASIYTTLCEFIPMLDQLVFPTVDKECLKSLFATTGVSIFCCLSSIAPVPLHRIFIPCIEKFHPDRANVSALAAGSTTLRNQTKCANRACDQTSESTRTNFKFCSACQAVRYCSKGCQAADWKEHKLACKSLKALLPIAPVYHMISPSVPAKDLTRILCEALKEKGLTDEDISYLWRYVHTHVRQAGDTSLYAIRGLEAWKNTEASDVFLECLSS